MAKGCTSVLIVFLIVITLPVWIGIAGGLLGIVGGLFGAALGVVAAVFGAIAGVIGSIFGSLFHPVVSVKPITILLIILVVILLARSGNKAVK
jgi:hypothetical protein